jgi:hypothetical protein
MAAKRAKANRSADEACGSAEPTTDGEATKTLVPAPAAEESTAPNTSDELRRIQLYADIAGRIYRALTKWLISKHKNLRVLGSVIVVVLLVLPLAAIGLIVLMFLWNPVHTFWWLTCSTGLVAGTNLVNRLLRRRR